MQVETRVALVCVMASLASSGQSLPSLFPFPNTEGIVKTYNAGNRPIDLTGRFFQSLV